MFYAQIKDGICTAVLQTEEGADFPGVELVEIEFLDDSLLNCPYTDGQFGPPIEHPVQVVSMKQARLALLTYGKLSDVDAAIAAMPSPQKEESQIEWDYSSTIERNNPVMLQLASALGLSDADVDALFALAATL